MIDWKYIYTEQTYTHHLDSKYCKDTACIMIKNKTVT